MVDCWIAVFDAVSFKMGWRVTCSDLFVLGCLFVGCLDVELFWFCFKLFWVLLFVVGGFEIVIVVIVMMIDLGRGLFVFRLLL